jgi:hypothetical protein
MSTLNVSNITDGTTTVGTSYVVNGSVRHWCRLNQTGTQTINDSFNTSSITDNGTGYTTFTLATAMADLNWSVQLTGTAAGTSAGTAATDSASFGGTGANPYRTTTNYNIRAWEGGIQSAIDHSEVNGSAYGSLA